MIQTYMAETEKKLKPGERQYFTLEPKATREERKFNSNNAETFRIFGWDPTPLKGVLK